MIAGFIIAFPKHGQKELVQICFNCVTFCHMDCDFATLVCRVIHLFVNVVCFFLPRHVSRIRYAVLHDSVATDRDRKLSVLMWVFPAAPLTSSFVTDPEIKPLYCQRLPFFFFSPDVGYNIALHASAADWISHFLWFVFPVHSTVFYPNPH